MGCFRHLINAIILSLAVIGFLSIGGKDLVQNAVEQYFIPMIENVEGRASKVADFTDINEDYEIEQAVGLMGFNGVLAEHKQSGQKLIVAESGLGNFLSADDIKCDDVEQKLKQAVNNLDFKVISVENIDVISRGELIAFDEKVPYIGFNAEIKGLPIKNVTGMISVAKDFNQQSKILLSVNENDKYSQIIAEEFFKQIR